MTPPERVKHWCILSGIFMPQSPQNTKCRRALDIAQAVIACPDGFETITMKRGTFQPISTALQQRFSLWGHSWVKSTKT